MAKVEKLKYVCTCMGDVRIVYIHTYIYENIFVYINLCILHIWDIHITNMDTYKNVFICTFTCILHIRIKYMYIYTYVFMCMYICILHIWDLRIKYMYTYKCMICMFVNVFICRYICILHICVIRNICMYIYIYACFFMSIHTYTTYTGLTH